MSVLTTYGTPKHVALVALVEKGAWVEPTSHWVASCTCGWETEPLDQQAAREAAIEHDPFYGLAT